ncbi:MAG: FAD-dependent oxidoreductase [Chloroflexota bacterium]
MRGLSVLVLGGGMAGLCASLSLARDGHSVLLVERDQLDVGDPADAFNWDRSGIPHFMQPHAFIPRGRRELRELFPDVFDSLLRLGAWDLDLRPKIRGAARAGDEELAYLALRRPLMEWALRSAVSAETGIRALPGTRVTGLAGKPGTPPRVTGAVTTEGVFDADLVVDAMGRRSRTSDWIAEMGGTPAVERSTDCGILYYSRYYRVRPGASLPDGRWLPTPRGDLGYAGFSSFPGDNGTFAAVLGTPPGDQALKLLRQRRAFDAAIATMPALDSWTNADISEPITDVLPMGSLKNTIRIPTSDVPVAIGLVSVADAICHTDPALALGLSFSLIHARALRGAVRDYSPDLASIGAAFLSATRAEMEERFDYASAIDEARARRWAGEPVDFAHRDGGAYGLFTLVAGTAAALEDGDVFRAVVRRNTFLDPLAVLDEDEATQRRIETLFDELRSRGGPPPGPGRDELLSIMDAAIRREEVSSGPASPRP